jgi:transcriptional regulator with XRE-family HTH domain
MRTANVRSVSARQSGAPARRDCEAAGVTIGRVDDRTVGLIVRALRRRRGWRQLDLAREAGSSQALVSVIERGHLDATKVRVLRKVFKALDAGLWIDLRWRGGAAARLLDEDHARPVGAVADGLQRLGWSVHTEVTYSVYGERGSIDLLAWHEATGALLVVEVKTELDSAEATLRKLDEKTRLAPTIVQERYGWRAGFVSRVLVLAETSVNRRRLASHARLFDTALPAHPTNVRRWLRHPVGRLDGRWFLPLISPGSDRRSRGGRHRVRCLHRAA